MSSNQVIIKNLGRQPYQKIWQAMQSFTDQRSIDDLDQIWIVEHDPVFTQGTAGKPEHVLDVGDIPIIKTDRGGQVTYHGPGQLVIYPLINIKRLKLGVRDLVTAIEQSIIEMMAQFGVDAYAKCDAPGVYVDNRKLASLGLRIRKGCSFHGLAVNINMDLSPFLRINPCGYAGMEMVQAKDLGGPQNVTEAGDILTPILIHKLGLQN